MSPIESFHIWRPQPSRWDRRKTVSSGPRLPPCLLECRPGLRWLVENPSGVTVPIEIGDVQLAYPTARSWTTL